MKIFEYNYGDSLPINDTAIALGFFDGVHLAHRELISLTVAEAKARGLIPTVFTFSAEDASVKAAAARIYPTGVRLSILEELGVECAVVADFGSVCGLLPDSFVKEVLTDACGMRLAVSGYNFRFGKGASAGAQELHRLCTSFGAECLLLEERSYDGEAISSTRIRAALESGDVRLACELLGAPYRMRGVVERGRGVGHRLGFPTVNTRIPDGAVKIKNGVYKTAVATGEGLLPGITNVGVCPTFEEREAHAETFIKDFKGDLYGQEVEVLFLDFIREERKFKSSAELIMQINIDKSIAFGECDRETER